MRILIAITGASGAIYAERTLLALKKHPEVEPALMASVQSKRIWQEELGSRMADLDLPLSGPENFDVPFVSGSNRAHAMVVVPCSMGTLGRIAHGMSDDAITRAADVMLKEKGKLILVPRETPFSLIHLDNMRLVALAGGLILPASPSFYSKPQTLAAAVDTVVARILDHLGITNDCAPRWMKGTSKNYVRDEKSQSEPRQGE